MFATGVVNFLATVQYIYIYIYIYMYISELASTVGHARENFLSVPVARKPHFIYSGTPL